MSCTMSLLRCSIPWIAVLVPPYLLFASFSGYGVVSISITTSVLVVSTIAFTFSKQKHKILKKSSVQEEPQNVNFGQVEEVLSLQNPRIEKGVAQNEIFGQVKQVLSVKNPRIEKGVAQNEIFKQVEEVLSVQNPRIENGVAQNDNFKQVELVSSVHNPKIEKGVSQNGNFGQVEQVSSVQNPRIEKGVSQNGNFGQVEQVSSVKNPRIENGVAQNENFKQVEQVLSVQNPRIENGVTQIHDLFSESESLGGPLSSSEDSDIEWPFSGELEQSPLCSDGSISDEESLIEIALPSGQFVKDTPKFSFHQQHHQKVVFADLVPQSIFQQHCFMDFLADISDVYEEDNLIEIDISMGSIKCSGFEISA
ncbi:uncharacterized protein LOC107024603 [Solanum pennellii]|uniref:Uncharacterized protein LOC107024603 n=1 Tax=Solanum pennellii TaxID=28526 RepID=A0ABM1H6N0_SOLPN|nr:uncharacterized protein LOC107024603 [Solanum pennellii]